MYLAPYLVYITILFMRSHAKLTQHALSNKCRHNIALSMALQLKALAYFILCVAIYSINKISYFCILLYIKLSCLYSHQGDSYKISDTIILFSINKHCPTKHHRKQQQHQLKCMRPLPYAYIQ